MEPSIQPEESKSFEMKNNWEDYNKMVQNSKMDLTYKVLVDLDNINTAQSQQNKPQQSDQQAKDIQEPKETKNNLIKAYIEAIRSIGDQFAQKEMAYTKEQIQENRKFIINKEIVEQDIKSKQLLEIQQDLNTELTTTLQNLQKFIQSVTLRTKHQRYLNDQNEIDAYIGRQRSTFTAEKGQIQRVVRNHNDLMKQNIEIANSVCRDKESEIDNLTNANSCINRELENGTKKIQELRQKEQQIYKEITNFTQRILQIKAQSKAKFRQNKKISAKKYSNQNHLTNSHLGSQIASQQNLTNAASSISVPEIGSQQAKPSTKCQIAVNDFRSELYAQKMLIFVVILISLVVSLW